VLPPRPEWNEPSDRYGAFALLRNFLPLIFLYGCLPYLANYSAYLLWALAPFTGLLLYRLTIVMHDCGHGTLFRSRKTNRWVGEFLGAVTGIDFNQFRQMHSEHHRDYGKTNDPQGFQYIGIADMSRAAFVWHLCKPLLGANLRYVFAESYLHPKNMIRMFRSGRFLFVVPVQLGLLAVITGLGSNYWAALVPPISAATVGLFLSQIRGIAEHGVDDASRQIGFVQSHEPKLIDMLLLYDLNFNLHEEHHRQPQIPSCHLPAAQESMSRRIRSDSMWHRVKALAG
jgi:fatty acid desaturase